MIREKIIASLVKGKNVLDIGSVGQTGKYSLWNLLKTLHCKTLTGIDLPDSVNNTQKIFKLSSNEISTDKRIIYGNMETYKFNKKFEVIIAGDVIEHVNNQGLFLNNIYNHLTNTGILVITTPNAKWLPIILKPNPTHTCWHDIHTLKRILNNSNFKVIKFMYYPGNKNCYNPFLKLLIFRQAILVICQKS